VYVEQEARLEAAAAILSRCYTLSAEPPAQQPLIHQVVA